MKFITLSFSKLYYNLNIFYLILNTNSKTIALVTLYYNTPQFLKQRSATGGPCKTEIWTGNMSYLSMLFTVINKEYVSFKPQKNWQSTWLQYITHHF